MTKAAAPPPPAGVTPYCWAVLDAVAEAVDRASTEAATGRVAIRTGDVVLALTTLAAVYLFLGQGAGARRAAPAVTARFGTALGRVVAGGARVPADTTRYS